jgi:dynein heavy chain
MQDIINFIEQSVDSQFSIHVSFNSFLGVYDSILKEHFGRPISRAKIFKSFNKSESQDVIEDIFHYSLIWTFGILLAHSNRSGFNLHMIDLFRVKKSGSRLAQILRNQDINIFELQFDHLSCTWTRAIKDMPESKISNIIIRQQKYIIKVLLKHDKPVLFTGALSTGKSRLSNNILSGLCEENPKTTGITMSCLLKTDVLSFITRMRNILVKNPDGIYRPSNGGKLLLFIDDLHMAPTEGFHENRPYWEFIRSFIDHKGFWANPQTFWQIENVIIMATMDSKNNITKLISEKILRQFSVVNMNEWDCIQEECSSYLSRHLMEASNSNLLDCMNVNRNIRSIAKASLDLVFALKDRVAQHADFPFHVFTIHHLRSLYGEFLNADIKEFEKMDSFIDLWMIKCDEYFKNRLDLCDREVYEDMFYSISCKNFGIHDVMTLNRLKTGLLSDNNKAKIEEKIKNRFVSHNSESGNSNGSNFMNIEELGLFPNAYNYCLSLDDTLSKQTDSHATFRSSPDTGISRDIIHNVVHMKDVSILEFSCFESEIKKYWQGLIRKNLHEILSVDRKKSVFIINIPYRVKVSSEFYTELHCLMDGAKANLWWTAKEYEELKSMVASQMILKTKLGNPVYEKGVDELSRTLTDFEIADFWSFRVRSNLSIIISIDTRDMYNLRMLSRYPRIVSVSQSNLLCSFNLEGLKTIASNFYLKVLHSTQWEEIISSISIISAEIFFNSTQGENGVPLRIIDYIESLKLTHSSLTETQSASDTQIQLQTATYNQLCIVKQKMVAKLDAERKYLSFLPDELVRILEDSHQLKLSMENNDLERMDLNIAIKTRIDTEIKLGKEFEEKRIQNIMKEITVIYENGLKALYSIKKTHLEELKVHITPPADLGIVAQALCVLFDTRHTIWASARKLLSSHTFLEKCFNYDPKNISLPKIEKLQKLFDSSVFSNSNNSKSPAAVKSLWIWLKAMVKYAKVLLVRIDEKASEKIPTGSIKLEESDKLNVLKEQSKIMLSQYKLLLIQKQEAVGRLALLGEIFSPDSIFSKPKPDPTVYS